MPKTPAGATRARIHDFMCQRILLGEPPSVREVQDAFSFKSTATAREHLDALVETGLLEHESGKHRGYRLPGAFVPGLAPLLGRVQAGSLTEAVAFADGYVPVSADLAANCFALTVRGESMSGREIHDGDIVLVQRDARIKSGDVVVALLGDEATIKTFVKVGQQIILQAENPLFDDIDPGAERLEFSILGRVFEVRRSL
jgi:repressor LexA